MPTFPVPSRPLRQPPWPRVIVLVVILVFVLAMAMLGYTPEAAVGIAVAALAAAGLAADRRLPDAQA